jgi:hypothetical protein
MHKTAHHSEGMDNAAHHSEGLDNTTCHSEGNVSDTNLDKPQEQSYIPTSTSNDSDRIDKTNSLLSVNTIKQEKCYSEQKIEHSERKSVSQIDKREIVNIAEASLTQNDGLDIHQDTYKSFHVTAHQDNEGEVNKQIRESIKDKKAARIDDVADNNNVEMSGHSFKDNYCTDNYSNKNR